MQRSKEDSFDVLIELQVFTSLHVYIDDDRFPHVDKPITR